MIILQSKIGYLSPEPPEWNILTVQHLSLHIYLTIPTQALKLHDWKLVVVLTHWDRVTHICVGKLTIIGSDNGLSPGRRQAII